MQRRVTTWPVIRCAPLKPGPNLSPRTVYKGTRRPFYVGTGGEGRTAVASKAKGPMVMVKWAGDIRPNVNPDCARSPIVFQPYLA